MRLTLRRPRNCFRSSSTLLPLLSNAKLGTVLYLALTHISLSRVPSHLPTHDSNSPSYFPYIRLCLHPDTVACDLEKRPRFEGLGRRLTRIFSCLFPVWTCDCQFTLSLQSSHNFRVEKMSVRRLRLAQALFVCRVLQDIIRQHPTFLYECGRIYYHIDIGIVSYGEDLCNCDEDGE